MLNNIDQSATTSYRNQEGNINDHDHHEEEQIRDIHALTPPHQPARGAGVRDHHHHHNIWETGHQRSSTTTSMASTDGGSSSENFTTMSREFNALVLAGSSIDHHQNGQNHNVDYDSNSLLARIGEEDRHNHHDLDMLVEEEENNPLAIVPDSNNYPLNPVASSSSTSFSRRVEGSSSSTHGNIIDGGGGQGQSGQTDNDQMVSVQRVKKEEVESKISAWQNAKVSKINNRFKREDAVIIGWENEQVQKATSWMKKIEV